MRYELVIFDFDGTLADSFGWFVEVYNDAARKFGFRAMEEGELGELRGLSGRELMKHAGVSPWKLPSIVRHVRRLKTREGHRVALFPGVEEVLRRLSEAGVTLAVATSNSRANVVRALGPENAALIRHWECDISLFGKKAGFRRVLRRSGIAPARALCVGDEIRDADAARAAGIPFGAVSWGYTTADALRASGPAEMFARVDEIVEVVTGAACRRR
ncbi:MAG TPA: HAD hydrolase-like protein [Longimicrobium sp.]|jgi:phosphoglycolate phosphatase